MLYHAVRGSEFTNTVQKLKKTFQFFDTSLTDFAEFTMLQSVCIVLSSHHTQETTLI